MTKLPNGWHRQEGCDACGAAECAHRTLEDGTALRACQLDAFIESYLETALWSSVDEHGEALDAEHGIEDFSLESLCGAIDDCASFQADNADDLIEQDDAQAGHDFWLTRNGHGAGFWDGAYPEDIGDRLTAASKPYGTVDLYAHEGKIYGH